MCEELDWIISGCSESAGIWCSEQFGDHVDANRMVDNEQNASDQRDGARKHVARLRTKIRKSSRLSSMDKLCSNAGVAEINSISPTLDDAEFDKLGGSC